MKYELKRFEINAEQFIPQLGKKCPSGVTRYDDDDFILTIQKSWLHGSSNSFPDEYQNLQPGDWIVKTNRGEVYRMSDYDFKRTYQVIENQ